MFPKEHGAYGQLLFPLATALAIGKPGVAALTLVSAALCAFLAHEPLLVLLGERGARAAREQRVQAWRWLSVCAVLSLASGVAGLIAGSPEVRAATAISSALAAMLGIVIVTRREHTMGGEIVSALALASLALPVALAAGVETTAALSVTLSFAAAFVVATVCVHAVIVHTRRPPAVRWRIAGAGVAAAATIGLEGMATRGVIAGVAVWAPLPVCVGGFLLMAAPPSSRQLRTVGWVLVATTLALAAILIVMLR